VAITNKTSTTLVDELAALDPARRRELAVAFAWCGRDARRGARRQDGLAPPRCPGPSAGPVLSRVQAVPKSVDCGTDPMPPFGCCVSP
jgi:hypothetical protein